MKILSRPKHIIVTAFIFFAIFSFLFPVITNAASLDSVFYDGMLRPGEQLSIRSWGKSFIAGNAVDLALALACGGENDKEKIWGENGTCIPPLDQYQASLEGGEPRITGGLMSMGAMAMDYSVSDPVVPTNMALFLDDTFDKTIFSTKSTYAADDTGSLTNLSLPTKFFQDSTFTLWKTSRNVSLGLLGVLLAIAGLSILFRSKLSPQVTVTISNVLPYLPISIIGIVLSYPIMAIAFNLLSPLMSIAYNIGISVYNQLASQSTVEAGAGLYVIMTGLAAILLAPITWVAASTVTGVGLVLSFPLVIVMLIAIYLLLVGVFRYIFEYAKTVVLFVFYVTVFPIISAIAILPGKQNLLPLLFKKVLANLLALPIMTLLVIVGLGFIASMANTNGATPGEVQYILGGSGGAIFAAIIKFAIGFGIISQSFKSRSIIEGALGAGGDIMSSLKGGSAGGPPGRK